MVITSKRGHLDEVVTFEFICDTSADMADIDPAQITLGSIAIVLQGQDGLEVYMATSTKQWIKL